VELEDVMGAAGGKEGGGGGQQVRDGERLDEIVVRTTVEPAYAVIDGVLGGEDQDGRLQAALAQGRQDLQPLSMGKHEIEDDAIERLVVGEEEAFLPRRGQPDVVMLGLQPFPERLRDLFL